MPARIVVPLIGEPLPLDFVNTARTASGDSGDVLATTAGLENWLLAEADRLPAARPTDATLAGIRRLRAGVAAIIDSARRGDRPPPDAVDVVNGALRAAPSYAQLSWGEAGAQIDTVRAGPSDVQLLAALAEATAELLASGLAGTTRECAAPDCALLFLPTHPRRRWCSATVCGNRTRVARYYQRHRLESIPKQAPRDA